MEAMGRWGDGAMGRWRPMKTEMTEMDIGNHRAASNSDFIDVVDLVWPGHSDD
jgi:hypothetical protein